MAMLPTVSLDAMSRVSKRPFMSFRRKPESRSTKEFWTPAFAGETAWSTFYEFINLDLLRDLEQFLLGFNVGEKNELKASPREN